MLRTMQSNDLLLKTTSRGNETLWASGCWAYRQLMSYCGGARKCGDVLDMDINIRSNNQTIGLCMVSPIQSTISQQNICRGYLSPCAARPLFSSRK
jgi:hypothetical protein